MSRETSRAAHVSAEQSGNGAEQTGNGVSKSGEVSRHSRKHLNGSGVWSRGRGAEQRLGVTKIGLSAEQKIGHSRSANMLCCQVQPWASCEHTCASGTKQCNLVPANGR